MTHEDNGRNAHEDAEVWNSIKRRAWQTLRGPKKIDKKYQSDNPEYEETTSWLSFLYLTKNRVISMHLSSQEPPGEAMALLKSSKSTIMTVRRKSLEGFFLLPMHRLWVLEMPRASQSKSRGPPSMSGCIFHYADPNAQLANMELLLNILTRRLRLPEWNGRKLDSSLFPTLYFVNCVFFWSRLVDE